MNRILIIDNEIEIVDIITDVYRSKYKVKIDSAFNGEDGLRLAKQTKYNVICVDYNMPRLNGIDFLKKIKCEPGRNKNTLVLFVTGYELEPEVSDELWKKVCFIQKPFDKEDFYNYSMRELDADSLLRKI